MCFFCFFFLEGGGELFKRIFEGWTMGKGGTLTHQAFYLRITFYPKPSTPNPKP